MTAEKLLTDDAAVDELARRSQADDAGASSHWRKYHGDFRYSLGEFEGLQGFGSLEPRRSFVRSALHRVLQRSYRRHGAAMPEFARLDALMQDIAKRQNRIYGLDLLRQTLAHSVVSERVPAVAAPDPSRAEPMTAAVIGDGFGALAALILAADPRSRVLLINLTKTLLVDVVYLRRAIPGMAISLAEHGREVERAFSRGFRVIAIEATRHDALRAAPIDIVYNIVSMQEMDPPTVAAYFADMRAVARRRAVHFYCCNRVEKTLPDGAIVRFADYPWSTSDTVIFDELCPWHQAYYTLRPPFFHPYDGPIQHRLAKLAGAAQVP